MGHIVAVVLSGALVRTECNVTYSDIRSECGAISSCRRNAMLIE